MLLFVSIHFHLMFCSDSCFITDLIFCVNNKELRKHLCFFLAFFYLAPLIKNVSSGLKSGRLTTSHTLTRISCLSILSAPKNSQCTKIPIFMNRDVSTMNRNHR